MKIVEKDQPIVAMALINPQLCKQLTIHVELEQEDGGPIPYLQVYHDRTRNPKKCSYVRLDRPEYSPHHKDAPPLTRKLKKEFIKLMNDRWGRERVETLSGTLVTTTGYQRAVDIWVETFEDGDYSKFNLDENGLPIVPDYTQL